MLIIVPIVYLQGEMGKSGERGREGEPGIKVPMWLHFLFWVYVTAVFSMNTFTICDFQHLSFKGFFLTVKPGLWYSAFFYTLHFHDYICRLLTFMHQFVTSRQTN